MRALLTLAAVAALAAPVLVGASAALAAETAAPMAAEATLTVNEAKQVVRKMLVDQNSQLRVGTAERQGDTAVVTLVSPDGVPARKVRIDLRTGQPAG
jgi:hypothetical protein